MSRFLDYGIFVPGDKGAQTRSSIPNSSAGNRISGKWAQVGSKWVKVGPDGKPLDSSSSSTSCSSVTQEENVSRPRPPAPVAISSGGDQIISGLTDPSAQTGKPNNDAAGKCHARDVGRLGDNVYEKPEESWDTPPTTASECNDEQNSSNCSGTSPNPTAPGGIGKDSLRSTGANAPGDGNPYDEQETWGIESLVRESSSEMLTVKVVNEGEKDNNTSPIVSTSRSTPVLTPGLSRAHSKDEITHKFFGDDACGEARRERAVSASGAFVSGPMSNAACVGERARSEGRGRKGRRKAEKAPVETRDVACQWDGSEMGDVIDEEGFPQVDLPDTPDCKALTAVLRLYDHARLENKRRGVLSSRPGWGVEENIEKWDGVYLDTDDRVVALDVDGDPENRQAVLIGPLPVELALMDHLEQLTMRRHRFKGRIPAELGKLNRLTHLNLSNCRLIGFIPVEFGDLSNLVVLNLSWNFLSGELPAELGRLAKLEELLLNSNAFSGPIPPEFGKLRSLQRFNAGHNIGLSGTLPPEMCRMSQLAVLDLRHNRITGRIPPIFGRLANLQQLWLQDNQLTDDIPVEIARLQKLRVLNLTNNKLSGVIPLALRGHPRYMAFKILQGNVALGERAALSVKEIDLASRKEPTDAMTHASVALANSQRELMTQQRRVSHSMSPAREEVNRRRTTGGDISSFGEPTAEELKRRSGGRASLGRKIRSMKRVMGRKATPPVTPTRQRSRADTVESLRSRSPSSASAQGYSSVVANPAAAAASSAAAVSKSFLEGGSQHDNGVDQADGSPNPTASVSTGTGPSVNVSPSSHDGEGQ